MSERGIERSLWAALYNDNTGAGSNLLKVLPDAPEEKKGADMYNQEPPRTYEPVFRQRLNQDRITMEDALYRKAEAEARARLEFKTVGDWDDATESATAAMPFLYSEAERIRMMEKAEADARARQINSALEDQARRLNRMVNNEAAMRGYDPSVQMPPFLTPSPAEISMLCWEMDIEDYEKTLAQK